MISDYSYMQSAMDELVRQRDIAREDLRLARAATLLSADGRAVDRRPMVREVLCRLRRFQRPIEEGRAIGLHAPY